MNKVYINILSIITLSIILFNILNLKNKLTEKFTDLEKINGIYGARGEKGGVGVKGPTGSKGDNGRGHIGSINITTPLKLGTKRNIFIPKNDNDNNSYTQLALSRGVNKNGYKLHIESDTSISSDGNNNNKSPYSIFSRGADNNTDFYINKKELYVNGDFDLDGSIVLEHDDMQRRLPDDLLPIGTIFPYYIDMESHISNGYYNIKPVSVGDTAKLYIAATTATAAATAGATATAGSANVQTTENVYILDLSDKIYVEYNTDNTVYLKTIALTAATKTLGNISYLGVSNNTIITTALPDKNSKFKLLRNFTKNEYTIKSVSINKYIKYDAENLTCDGKGNEVVDKFSFIPATPPLWVECNGKHTSYTYTPQPPHETDIITTPIPDLRKRFIIHELPEHGFYLDKTGGEDTNISLDEDNLPSHLHNMDGDGLHSHPMVIAVSNSHNHKVNKILDANLYGSGISNSNHNTFVSGALTDDNYTNNDTNTAGSHSHDILVDSEDEHDHAIHETGYQTPKTVNVIPPYYKIVYIMKILDYNNNISANSSPLSLYTTLAPVIDPPTTTTVAPTTTTISPLVTFGKEIKDLTINFKSAVIFKGKLYALSDASGPDSDEHNKMYDISLKHRRALPDTSFDINTIDKVKYLYNYNSILLCPDTTKLRYFYKETESPTYRILPIVQYPNVIGININTVNAKKYVLKTNKKIYELYKPTSKLQKFYVLKGGNWHRNIISKTPPSSSSSWKIMFTFYAFTTSQPGTTEYRIYKKGDNSQWLLTTADSSTDSSVKGDYHNNRRRGYSYDFGFFAHSENPNTDSTFRFGIHNESYGGVGPFTNDGYQINNIGDDQYRDIVLKENGYNTLSVTNHNDGSPGITTYGQRNFWAYKSPAIRHIELSLTANLNDELEFEYITHIDNELIGITSNRKIYRFISTTDSELYHYNGSRVEDVTSIVKYDNILYGVDKNSKLVIWNGMGWIEFK